MLDILLTSGQDVKTYVEISKEYGKFLADIYVHPVIFFILVGILLCVYAVRFIIIVRKDKPVSIKIGCEKEYVQYVFAHMLTQLLICFSISYFCIKLTYAMIDSYIINWIISPIIGWFSSIIIDGNIIVKIENQTGVFKNPLNNKTKTEIKKDDINTQNNITINVGSSSNIKNINRDTAKNILENTTKYNEKNEDAKDKTERQTNDKMNETIVINETTEDMIKSLIDVQVKQSDQIHALSQVVDAIRESIMNDKKVLLKRLMYNALERGYTIPQEDERINLEYTSYKGLNGNGYIKELYEDRYLKLPMHSEIKKDEVV